MNGLIPGNFRYRFCQSGTFERKMNTCMKKIKPQYFRFIELFSLIMNVLLKFILKGMIFLGVYIQWRNLKGRVYFGRIVKR